MVKRGPNGAIGASRGRRDRPRAGAADVTVVDTIGAGDAFNAGFLFATARDDALADAIRQGIAHGVAPPSPPCRAAMRARP